MTEKTQTKFEAALTLAENTEYPEVRLAEFGADVEDCVDKAMEIAEGILPQIAMHLANPHELMLDLASLFMSGVNVGVELAMLKVQEQNGDQ
jgi:hypothetical protein